MNGLFRDSIENYRKYGVNGKAIEAAEDGLAEPEAEKGHRPTEAELRDIHRVETYEVQPEENENPQAILDKLYFAVKETRAGADVINIKFTKPGEAVIYFYTGASKRVNIECDSGIAMILYLFSVGCDSATVDHINCRSKERRNDFSEC